MFSVKLLYLTDMTIAAKNNVTYQPRTFYTDVTNSVTCWRSPLLISKPVMGTEGCMMWHYQCNVAEDYSLLICNNLSLGEWFLMNGRITLLHLQGSSSPTSTHRTTSLANDSVMNLWNLSPSNTLLFPTDLDPHPMWIISTDFPVSSIPQISTRYGGHSPLVIWLSVVLTLCVLVHCSAAYNCNSNSHTQKSAITEKNNCILLPMTTV
jgi:hypothetical protein